MSRSGTHRETTNKAFRPAPAMRRAWTLRLIDAASHAFFAFAPMRRGTARTSSKAFDHRLPRCRGALVAAAALTLAIICPMMGCTGSAGATTAITAGVASDVELLRSMDAQTASALFDSSFTDRLVQAGIDPSAVYGVLFAHLECRVVDVQVKEAGTVATARLAVTNVDIAQGLANYSRSLSQTLYERGQQAAADPALAISEAEYAQLLATTFTSALSDPGLASVTTEVEVTYRLKDGAWTCEDRGDLTSALLGGLDADELGQALS